MAIRSACSRRRSAARRTGRVTLNANGSFSYTPAADYYGVDSFVYRVCDPTLLCDTATVTITLAAVNDAPAAINDSFAVSEDVFHPWRQTP